VHSKKIDHRWPQWHCCKQCRLQATEKGKSERQEPMYMQWSVHIDTAMTNTDLWRTQKEHKWGRMGVIVVEVRSERLSKIQSQMFHQNQPTHDVEWLTSDDLTTPNKMLENPLS